MTDAPKLTALSCRAARALLGWPQGRLVQEAKVSPNTVAKVEDDESWTHGPPVTVATLAKLEAVFEAAGVEILNGQAPGARLRPRGDT